MGADGGTIPSRKELTTAAPKSTAQTAPSELVCGISSKRLDLENLVCDFHGITYNRKAVLEYLLAKRRTIPQLRKLKDVVALKPHTKNGRWCCPLSQRDVLLEYPSTRFMAISGCGHICHASVVKEACPICHKKIDALIVIGAKGQDLKNQQSQLAARQSMLQELNKKKTVAR